LDHFINLNKDRQAFEIEEINVHLRSTKERCFASTSLAS